MKKGESLLRLSSHLDMFAQRNCLTLFNLSRVSTECKECFPQDGISSISKQETKRRRGFSLFKSIDMKVLKQSVGIDVAQKELVVCLGRLTEDLHCELYHKRTFVNNQKGFAALLKWVGEHTSPEAPLQYVMEATGVYHEALAYYLFDHKCSLSVVLPNKISNYFRTLEVKTITDDTASQAIARFGLERRLDKWQRPSPVYKRLRQLTRERDALVQQRTAAKNQLHAEKAEAEPHPRSVERLTKLIIFLNKQVVEIQEDIKALLSKEEQVRAEVKRLCTLPGIGILTAVTILAETNGFELIRSKRQLASYAGLDVREKQSGTSVRGRSRISKKGNRFLRKAMHMPALSAVRYDQRFKSIYSRMVAKHGVKMRAIVPLQRKLLQLAYILFKNNTTYDKHYLEVLEPLQSH